MFVVFPHKVVLSALSVGSVLLLAVVAPVVMNETISWIAVADLVETVNQEEGLDVASEGSAFYVVYEYPDIEKHLHNPLLRKSSSTLIRNLAILSGNRAPRVRRRTAYTLGRVASLIPQERSHAIDLLSILEHDEDDEVSGQAVNALQHFPR